MPETHLIDNQKIAKNTLLLYFRMFLTMAVGLYTSRIVLNVLGVSDYGIFNIVAGVVTMLAFLNVGMIGASQRFLSFYLGNGQKDRLKEMFSTSVFIHGVISVIIFFISELLGGWLLNTYLDIPAERLNAANWVLQCSILNFVISVNSVPYNSCIIAHERMNVYAYISIAEVIMKLIIVFALIFAPWDKLIIYAILQLVLQLLIFFFYFLYCKKNFEESHCKIRYIKQNFTEMFSFAGWSMIGNMGFTLKDQGSNIIFNLFFGTLINGARGLASQVNAMINGFAVNFMMAVNPQITKQYAAGNLAGSMRLVYSGARMTFYLLTLIVIPFLINSHYLLKLWLGMVPKHTEMFVFFILISSLIYSLSGTISTAILATGKIKWFQISLAILLLSELPISYIILKLGGEPYEAMIPSLFTVFLSLILRIVVLKRFVSTYSYRNYLLGVVMRCMIVFCICFGWSYYFRSFLNESFLTVVLSSLFTLIVNSTIIYIVGITSIERTFARDRVKAMFYKLSCSRSVH